MIFKPKNKNQIITIKTLSDLCDTIELEQTKNIKSEETPTKITETIKEYIQPIENPIVEKIIEPEIVNIPELKTDIQEDIKKVETNKEQPKQKLKLVQVGVNHVKKSKSGDDIKWL